MNANQATPRLPNSQPLTEQIVGEVLAALRSVEVAVAGFWKRAPKPSSDWRAFATIEHLDARTLKDIGAPHWLVARAVERREAQQLRWIELDVR